MVVSRNALSLIRKIPVKGKPSGQRPPQLPQPRKRDFFLSVSAYLELSGAGDANLDLIAVLQVQCVYDTRGQPDSKTISPFRYLHDFSWIYIILCISAP